MALGFSGSNGGVGKDKMALGLSGSNGGVGKGKKFLESDINRPLEVSYFVNNICNLICEHCYVGYENKEDELSLDEWKNVFDKLIDMGALTFGNVGKEPLLSDKTVPLLHYFSEKRKDNSKLRFGFVTNGILLKGSILEEIASINPTYIDVSLDGTKEENDFIRGNGSYQKTIENLKNISMNYPDLKENIFISFTLMNHNKGKISDLAKEMNDLGINNLLISPYMKTPNSNGNLKVDEDEIVNIYKNIIENPLGLNVFLKSDFDAQKGLIEKLVNNKIIDVNENLLFY